MDSQSPLRILLIDKDPGRASQVCEVLRSDGHDVIRQPTGASDLTAAIARDQPDMVIIDIDSPDRDVLETMSTLDIHNTRAPRPIELSVNEPCDRGTIHGAVKAGVTAYLVDGIDPGRACSIIDSTVVEFELFQALRTELEESRSALEDRKTVEKAKSLIMQHERCDEEAACTMLRNAATEHNQRLVVMARRVIKITEGRDRHGNGSIQRAS